MNTLRKILLLSLAAILTFSMSGCSAVAALFATATPTPTNTSTPTSTPTPTNTPTPTFTPTRTRTPTMTPTDTPTSTPTNTPTSTFTPTLTLTLTPTLAPYINPTLPTCGETNSPIRFNNQTGNPIELHLSGKIGNFIVYLTTGENFINICSGQYTYTVYGCGGNNISGTISTGQGVTFVCKK